MNLKAFAKANLILKVIGEENKYHLLQMLNVRINVFDEIVALSGYGDLGKNILMESYLTTFSFLDFGKGSAMTYIVLFFALLLGIFYLRNLNKEVDY